MIEGSEILVNQLNFFLYIAIKDIRLFKNIQDSGNLERSLYETNEFTFREHKMTNLLLAIALCTKHTELLKVFLQKHDFTFSLRDFSSFTSICLQDYPAHQHLLKNMLTLYPTPSLFQQLDTQEQEETVKLFLERVPKKDLPAFVVNVLSKKPYLSQALVFVFSGEMKQFASDIAKAALMNLTEEDLVALRRGSKVV